MARFFSTGAISARIACLSAIAALAAACGKPEPPAMPPMSVAVTEVQPRDIPIYLDMIGQAAGIGLENTRQHVRPVGNDNGPGIHCRIKGKNDHQIAWTGRTSVTSGMKCCNRFWMPYCRVAVELGQPAQAPCICR